ncbi:class I SAM-dependent methyltransferase [Methylocystis hirsuta]|nr:methyltransferase domain-containing protein [Methylocystis hirsuta]
MPSVDKYRNSKGLIWLNVASSTYSLEEFTNFDNHIFLRLSRLPSFLTDLLPAKYHQNLDDYRKARRTALMVQHDCRKALPLPDSSVDHVLCSHFLEHVYPGEADLILRDFHRVLKRGGTIQIIVPDLEVQADDYCRRKEQGDPAAADEFVKATLLTTEARGTVKFRIMNALGAFGLQHCWMYDYASMSARIANAGFEILDENDTPSRNFRAGDDSVHIVARKGSEH